MEWKTCGKKLLTLFYRASHTCLRLLAGRRYSLFPPRRDNPTTSAPFTRVFAHVSEYRAMLLVFSNRAAAGEMERLDTASESLLWPFSMPFSNQSTVSYCDSRLHFIINMYRSSDSALRTHNQHQLSLHERASAAESCCEKDTATGINKREFSFVSFRSLTAKEKAVKCY